MIKKVADAAPATFVTLGSGYILGGAVANTTTMDRLNQVLPWPWSAWWVAMIFIGGSCVIAGVCLRSRDPLKNGRPQDVGQGLELFGNSLVGSMFLVYMLILAAQFPVWTIIPSLCWFLALAATFWGPFAVIVRDIIRAHRGVI